MPPPSCSLSPEHWFCSTLGGLPGTRFLLLSLSISPKLEAESVAQNIPTGAVMRGGRSQTCQCGCFIPQQLAQGCRPATDLHLIWTCDSFTDVWVRWQKDSLKQKQCRNKTLHCLSITVFFGGAYVTCTYRHQLLLFIAIITTFFFPHSLFIAAPGAFIFTGRFTNFVLVQASSFHFILSFCWRRWGTQPAHRQGTRCLSLLWFCCYQHRFVTYPNWVAFTAVLPIPLTRFCFKKRSLYRGSTPGYLTKGLPFFLLSLHVC